MDAYEATRIVFSRIQTLDPENASKIMGLLLIQDQGEKEMIRLAFGPESLLHSVVLRARNDLGVSSNTPSTPSTPSSPSPFFTNSTTNPISITRQNNSASFPPSRMLNNLNPSLSMSSSSWAPSSFSDLQNQEELNHHHLINNNPQMVSSNNNGFGNMGSSSNDLIDEFQLQDQLSFLNEQHPKNSDLFYPQQQQPEGVSSPNSSSTEGGGMLFPSYAANWGAAASMNGNHRRSCSVTDICLGSDPLGSGLGWKPCLYYNRGFCKNGTSCRFLHGLADPSDPSTAMVVGSPKNNLDVMEQCQELLLRSKTQQQQQQLRLNTASQLMGSSAFPYSPTSAAGKCMNFLLQQQQSDTQRAAAAALMLGEDVHKFGRSRMERNDFCSSGGGMVNPGSRQIYLTFPADSTFREEDVSNYFSIYGPVQDVRIPYQQKRMFGFVTFVYPETVKLILAKGNPHFVCDARVLVKPYKEKGKVPDKKHQQMERGDYSPTGLDPRDASYDLPLGPRMFNNTQDMLLRRKLEEQAELQQAIELQSRRLMSLQLLDVKKHHHHRNLSAGAAMMHSPHSPYMHHPTFMSDRSSPEFADETFGSPATAGDQHLHKQTMNPNAGKEDFFGDGNGNGSGNANGNGSGNNGNGSGNNGNVNGNGNGNGDASDGKESPKHEDNCNFHDSLEHNLPDSPFASPLKSGGDPSSFFSTSGTEAVPTAASSTSSASNASNNVIASSAILPPTSTLDMASLKSCFFQIPRFSSGHGAIGM